jgi:enoyl-CoA hydratase/carnithine racemase
MAGTLEIDRPLDGVLRLSIANPRKRNALDMAILDAIADALGSLDGERCVVLTGSGGMFSSGYDIGKLSAETFAVDAEKLVAHPFSAALSALDDAGIPTLAALCGSAIGGGLELALGCDLRIASAGIELGMPPAKLGLIYSHTGLRRFLDAIGEPRTRELFLLGRYIDAPTALSWGLVNWVVPDEELESVTLELAGELAANAPLAMSGNKSVLRELLGSRAALHPEIEQELLELRESSFHSHDLREGVTAFSQKRAPSWKGR